MSKFGQVILVVIGVSILYLLMLVVMPIMVDVASTANATITSDSNPANYPGGTSFLLAIPWICWFVPAILGMALIVFILRDWQYGR